MSSSKKNTKTETSKKRALSTRKPKLTPALATTPSLSTLTQSESLGLTSTDQTTFNNLFSQALARHKKDVFEDRKDKLKEISHLALMAEEYLSTFALIGYSLQDERVVMMNMPTSKDEAALVDLLRATFIDIANNRP